MQIDVTTDEVELDLSDYPDTGKVGGQSLVLQNLGAGDVYYDFMEGVSSTTGVKLEADQRDVLAFAYGTRVFVVGSAAADLRYAVVG